MAQLSAQLEEAQMSANHATELLESEQMEKRHLQEELAEISVSGGGGWGSEGESLGGGGVRRGARESGTSV